MFARPKRGETEEDILKFQEDFLRCKQSAPSAAVLRKRKSEEENEGYSGTYASVVRQAVRCRK
jgi:hypothetical protein